MSRKSINQAAIANDISVYSKEEIHLCFKYGFAFECVKTKKFTNFFKDNNNFIEFINKLFNKDIPELSNKKFDDIKRENRHFHKIESAEKDLVLDIIKDIVKIKNPSKTPKQINDFLAQTFFGTNFFQIGTTNGLRIIGVLSANNIFEILFFDPHHLIYPSKNYNQKDYFIYDYSPCGKVK